MLFQRAYIYKPKGALQDISVKFWISMRPILSGILRSRFVILFVSLVFLFIVLKQIDTSEVLAAGSKLSATHIFFAALAILINALLSCLRLGVILRDFGFPLPLINSFRANIYGHLAGMVMFQVVGQALGRTALLRRFGVSLSAVVVITAYERIAGLAVALVLAAIGAFHLFGTIAVDTSSGGATFIKIILGLMGACLAGVVLGYNGLVRQALIWLKDKSYSANIIKTVMHTFVAQGFMLAAYVSLAQVLAPSIALNHLLAACAIVSFAAALPISFSGWGVRELSSIYALGILGVNTEDALIVSILVGVLSLLSLVFLSIIINSAGLFLSRYSKKQEADHFIEQIEKEASLKQVVNFTSLIAWFVPLATATAIFFQLYLPTSAGKLNINLADAFVIVGGPALLILYYVRSSQASLWKIPHLPALAIVATAFILFSFIIGVFRFGVTDWALINRLSGWFVLMGYVSTGALIVFVEKEFAQKLVLRTFVAAAVSIVLLEMLPYLLLGLEIKLPDELLFYRSEGFAQDPNAFAFQLVLVLCVLLGFGRKGLWDKSSKLSIILIALVLVGIWNTLSRAGFLGVAGIVVIALAFRFIDWKTLLKSSLIACLILLFMAAFPIVAPKVLVLLGQTNGGVGASAPFWDYTIYNTLTEREDSNHERIGSIIGGLKLFYNHPFWGAGLGAFIHQHTQEFGKPLIIHSTPVWFLAEFGIIGSSFFMAAFGCLLWMCRPVASKLQDPLKSTVFLVLCGFGIMAMVHDLFFQRTFWFLLGVCLATPLIKLHGNNMSHLKS